MLSVKLGSPDSALVLGERVEEVRGAGGPLPASGQPFAPRGGLGAREHPAQTLDAQPQQELREEARALGKHSGQNR